MLKKKSQAGAGRSIPAGLGIGILVSIAITILSAAAIAWLVASEKIGEGSMDFLSGVIHVAAAALGAWIASALTKKMRLQVCLLTGLGYYLALLGVTALLFEGQYSGMGVTALLIAVGCVSIALLPTKNASLFKKKKHAYR